jgi:hypothetical protein
MIEMGPYKQVDNAYINYALENFNKERFIHLTYKTNYNK